MTELFQGSPYKIIENAYPGEFKQEDFEYFNKDAKLGLLFQAYIKLIYEMMGFKEGEDFLYNKKYKYCRYKVKCFPDFQFIKNNIWIDVKLANYTIFYHSRTLRYTEHSNKLIIIYLLGDKDLIVEYPKVEMKSVRTLYQKLRKTEEGKKIIISLNKVEKEAKTLY